MRCKRAQKYLSEYLDGELAPQQEERMRQHLNACTHCLQEYKKLQVIHALSREVLVEDPGPRFYHQLSKRLAEETQTAPPPLHRRSLLHLWVLAPTPAKALVAAGAAALVFFALLYPRLTTPTLPIENFEQEYLRSRDVLPWGEQPAASVISFQSGRG